MKASQRNKTEWYTGIFIMSNKSLFFRSFLQLQSLRGVLSFQGSINTTVSLSVHVHSVWFRRLCDEEVLTDLFWVHCIYAALHPPRTIFWQQENKQLYTFCPKLVFNVLTTSCVTVADLMLGINQKLLSRCHGSQNPDTKQRCASQVFTFFPFPSCIKRNTAHL